MISALAATLTFVFGVLLLALASTFSVYFYRTPSDEPDWFDLGVIVFCGLSGFSLCLTAVRSVGFF